MFRQIIMSKLIAALATVRFPLKKKWELRLVTVTTVILVDVQLVLLLKTLFLEVD